jgi:hypothetical protein
VSDTSPPAPKLLTQPAILPGWVSGPDRSRWKRLLVLALLLFCFFYGATFSLLAPYVLAPFAAPIIVLLFMVVWSLPELHSVPTGPMTVMFFAYFGALVLWPNYLAVALPGLPWITLARLASFPMAVLFLVCLSGSQDFRQRIAFSISGTPMVWKLLLIFVVIQTYSIFLSKHISLSFDKYIEAQVTWTIVFFASSYIFLRPKLIQQTAVMLWVMGIIVGMIGLWEFRLKHVPWAGHIPSFLKIDDPYIAIILAGVFREASGQYRIESTFSTSLGFGEYIALTVPFVLHFVVTTGRPSTRFAAACSVVFLMGMAVLSGTRLAAVGCLLTLLLYLLLIAMRRWQTRPDSLLGPAVALGYPAIFAAGVASTFFVGRIRHLVFGDGSQQGSTDDRIAQYKLGLPMVMHNPIGHGIGTGGTTLGYSPFGFMTIDTYYMDIALEYGVLGFFVYYSMFAIAIYQAGKHALFRTVGRDDDLAFLAPLAMALMNFIVIKSVFSQQDNHPLVFMMLGMTAALLARARAKSSPMKAPRADVLAQHNTTIVVPG